MKIITIICSGFLALLITLNHGFTQSRTATDSGLIEAAKKEGELVWYTSMSISDSRPLLDAFEKKYPFIKSKLVRASSEKTLNRIITETRGGKWDFDVVALSEVGALVQRNLTSPYVSAEAKTYSPKFKEPKLKSALTWRSSPSFATGRRTEVSPREPAPFLSHTPPSFP